jgi:hypothetical protein
MSLDFNRLCYTNEGKGSYITLKDLKRFLESNKLHGNYDFDAGWNHNIDTFIEKIEETLKERKETP